MANKHILHIVSIVLFDIIVSVIAE